MAYACRVCESQVEGEGDDRSPPGLRCEKCGAPLSAPGAVLGKVAVKRVRAEDLPLGPVVMGAVVPEPGSRGEARPISVVQGEFAAVRPSGAFPEPLPAPPEPLSAPRPVSVLQGELVAVRPASVMTGLVVPTKPRFGCTLVLEDSELQRTIVRDGLLQLGVAEQVLCSADGMDFLTTATQAFIAGAGVDLAIMDLELPGLGGYATALALRSVEKAFRRDPLPLLFFSAKVLDDTAKRALAGVGTAHFLSKDTSHGAGAFVDRLIEALRHIRAGAAP